MMNNAFRPQDHTYTLAGNHFEARTIRWLYLNQLENTQKSHVPAPSMPKSSDSEEGSMWTTTNKNVPILIRSL